LDLNYIISYTPFAVSIAILLLMIYRVRTLTTPTRVSARAPITEDYSSLLIELTNLRLRRDALRDMITKVYDLADKGKISEGVKRAIVERINRDLTQIEKDIEHLEKYEELNMLIEEKRKLEAEYRRKIKELDERISSLRKIIGPPSVKEEKREVKEKKKVKGKREVKEEKKRERRKELSQVMEEIMKMLSEAEV